MRWVKLHIQLAGYALNLAHDELLAACDELPLLAPFVKRLGELIAELEELR